MYALHDAGMAIHTMPLPEPSGPPPGQVERRAVEETEHSALEPEDRRDAVYTTGAAVVQLVSDSAEGYAEMLESSDQMQAGTTPSGTLFGENLGQDLDVYA